MDRVPMIKIEWITRLSGQAGWIEWIDAWVVYSEQSAENLWKIRETVDTAEVIVGPSLNTEGV
jgi:hypothetical protein